VRKWSGAGRSSRKSVARYLSQLDTADLQAEAVAAKTAHLKEKLAKLESEMQRASKRTFEKRAISREAGHLVRE